MGKPLAPPAARTLLHHIVWLCVLWFVRIVVTLCGGVRVYGADSVPRTGGVLFVSNHLSVADPPVLGMVLGTAPLRPAWFLGHEYLFRLPLLGPIFTAIRGLPVDPVRGQRRAIRSAVELLKRGDPVALYPEGRCSLDGRLQAFRPGAALIAWMARAPVVPVAMEGTDRLVPVGRFVPRSVGHRCVVRFGRPVPLPSLDSLPRQRWIRDATERMHDAVAELLAQSPKSKVQSPKFKVQSPKSRARDALPVV